MAPVVRRGADDHRPVGEGLQGDRVLLGQGVGGGHRHHDGFGEHDGANGEVGLADGQPREHRVQLSGAQRTEGVSEGEDTDPHLAVRAALTGMRAKDICLALDIEPLPKHVEGTRAKLKRW